MMIVLTFALSTLQMGATVSKGCHLELVRHPRSQFQKKNEAVFGDIDGVEVISYRR